ncbi:MAG: hypothetical protein ACI9UK_001336 [Candidatus Krumholzibacteriia bacterium]|jgi:hypothetical protein
MIYPWVRAAMKAYVIHHHRWKSLFMSNRPVGHMATLLKMRIIYYLLSKEVARTGHATAFPRLGAREYEKQADRP